MQTTDKNDRLTVAGALDVALGYYADGEASWEIADMFLLNRGLAVDASPRSRPGRVYSSRVRG